MREKRFSYMLRFIYMLSGAYPPSSACRYREIPGMAGDGEGRGRWRWPNGTVRDLGWIGFPLAG
jgi:hypothetical protein